MPNTEKNKNINSGVNYSGFNTLKEALDSHSAWLLDKEVGKRANFSNANFSNANLSYTNLSNANLQNADLHEANLQNADLSGTNLHNANLKCADLRGANLEDADLSGATLGGATLGGSTLENGLSWEKYLSEVVPALCIAGGKSLEEVAAVWNCHSWENCPMHIAFGVNSLDKIPEMYREEAERFIIFFDQKLIPNPTMTLGVK